MSRYLLPYWKAGFGVVMLLFMLPFFTVSCQHQPLASISGYQLIVGGTPNTAAGLTQRPATGAVRPSPYAGPSPWLAPPTNDIPRISPHWLAIVSLLLAGSGFALGLRRPQSRWPLPTGLAGAGLIALLLLKMDLEQAALRAGQGLLTISPDTGYWLTGLAFAATGLLAAWPELCRLALGQPPALRAHLTTAAAPAAPDYRPLGSPAAAAEPASAVASEPPTRP